MAEIEPTPTKKHPKRKRAFIIAGVVAVILLAGLGGIALRWWLQQRDYGRLARPGAIAETTEEAQNQVFAGDFGQAHETVSQALDNPKISDQAKIDLYLQQGAIYESQQDYAAAMESYRKAEALDAESYGVVLSIAGLAVLMDNKELAIEYYKKALELFPEDEDDPLRDQNRQYLEDWISILESGGPFDEGE